MNAIWITEEEWQLKKQNQHKNIISILNDERVEHCHSILKVKLGDEIKLCLVGLGLCTGCVVEISKQQLKISISQQVELKHQQHSQLKMMFIGLARPQTIKKILEYGTSMGVTHFYFLPAELSEKSYATSKVWQKENIEHHLFLGLAQSNFYFMLPKVEVLLSWKDIEVRLNHIKQRYLGSWQKNEIQFQQLESFAVALGPERGWTQQEEEFWRGLNFSDMSLGESVLRVETALVSALSKLS